MPVSVTCRFHFSAAHQNLDYGHGCGYVHGHNYTLDVTVSGPRKTEGPRTGMVQDAKTIKQAVNMLIVERFDHSFLLKGDEPAGHVAEEEDEEGVVHLGMTTTMENLAVHILYTLRDEAGLNVTKVRLQETPRLWCEVTP